MFENGLEWLKADFHLHTRKDKEFKYDGEDNDFIKDYVSHLKSEGVGVGVITNHNKFDAGEYKALKKRAKKESILILPGVELSVKEGNGIHTLIIFDPDDWIVNDENFISQFLTEAFAGIANSENSNTRCKFDLRDVIERLNSYGRDYFIIFAHVDQGNGLLKECTDGLLSSLSDITGFQDRVLALQKVRTGNSMERFEKSFGYQCTQVEGSDPKSMGQVGHCERKTYLKIGDLSFDAVKFALIDYSNRVSNSLPQVTHGYIDSISFVGGKLDDTTISLSPELNTFIGIRGSGKSSILEALRYTFDIKAQCDRQYKDELVKSVLGSGGQINVHIVDKYGKKYEVRRIYGERLNILDSNKNDLGITVDQILRNTLYFGQKDLSQSSSLKLQLLDKLVGNKIGDYSGELEKYCEELENCVNQLIKFNGIPAKIDELDTQRSNYEHGLKIFEERGIDEKLKKQTAFNLDRQKLSEIENNIALDIKSLEEVFTKLKVAYNALDDYNSDYNSEQIEIARNILHSISGYVSQIKNEVIKIKDLHEKYNEVIGQIDGKIESLKEEFAEVKRQITDKDLDVDSYSSLRENLETTKSQITALRNELCSFDGLKTNYLTAERKRNELLKNKFDAYLNEIQSINETQPELMVEIFFKGDKDKFFERLKASFKGTGITESKYKTIADQFTDFVMLIEDVILNEGAKCKKILSDAELVKLRDKIFEKYGEMIRDETPNRVEIKYHGKPLK